MLAVAMRTRAIRTGDGRHRGLRLTVATLITTATILTNTTTNAFGGQDHTVDHSCKDRSTRGGGPSTPAACGACTSYGPTYGLHCLWRPGTSDCIEAVAKDDLPKDDLHRPAVVLNSSQCSSLCTENSCPQYSTCSMVNGAATCPCDDDYLAVGGRECIHRSEGGNVSTRCEDDPPIQNYCEAQLKLQGACQVPTMRDYCRRSCGFCTATEALSCTNTVAINLNCPSRNISRVVPNFCEKSCGKVFVSWWDRCRSDSTVQKMDRLLHGQLSQFYVACMPQPTCHPCQGEVLSKIVVKVDKSVFVKSSDKYSEFVFDFKGDIAVLLCISVKQVRVLDVVRANDTSTPATTVSRRVLRAKMPIQPALVTFAVQAQTTQKAHEIINSALKPPAMEVTMSPSLSDTVTPLHVVLATPDTMLPTALPTEGPTTAVTAAVTPPDGPTMNQNRRQMFGWTAGAATCITGENLGTTLTDWQPTNKPICEDANECDEFQRCIQSSHGEMSYTCQNAAAWSCSEWLTSAQCASLPLGTTFVDAASLDTRLSEALQNGDSNVDLAVHLLNASTPPGVKYGITSSYSGEDYAQSSTTSVFTQQGVVITCPKSMTCQWPGRFVIKGIKSALVIVRLSIENQTAVMGGGALCADEESTVVVAATRIRNNRDNGDGGGAIYADNGAIVYLIRSTLQHNVAENGAAISLWSGQEPAPTTRLMVVNSILTASILPAEGDTYAQCAIFMFFAQMTLKNSTIKLSPGNTAIACSKADGSLEAVDDGIFNSQSIDVECDVTKYTSISKQN